VKPNEEVDVTARTLRRTLSRVSDGLDQIKQRVAEEHLGSPELGSMLKGGNELQLRRDAELVRREAGIRDNGRRSLEADLFAFHERRAAQARRLFGDRA
jgi:hypothetical protein